MTIQTQMNLQTTLTLPGNTFTFPWNKLKLPKFSWPAPAKKKKRKLKK